MIDQYFMDFFSAMRDQRGSVGNSSPSICFSIANQKAVAQNQNPKRGADPDNPEWEHIPFA